MAQKSLGKPLDCNFTQARLDKLAAPEKGDYQVKDLGNTNLSVRVHSSGGKYFEIRKRPKGEQNQIRVKIGEVGQLSVNQARIRANEIALEMAKGINLNKSLKAKAAKEKAKRKARGLSVTIAFNNYLADSPHLAKSTVGNYRKELRVVFKEAISIQSAFWPKYL